MLSWPDVTDENVAEFVGFYVDERKNLGDENITEEKLFAEISVHTPYVLLEQMVFAVTFDFASDEYMKILREEYRMEAKKLGRTVEYAVSGSDSEPITESVRTTGSVQTTASVPITDSVLTTDSGLKTVSVRTIPTGIPEGESETTSDPPSTGSAESLTVSLLLSYIFILG